MGITRLELYYCLVIRNDKLGIRNIFSLYALPNVMVCCLNILQSLVL